MGRDSMELGHPPELQNDPDLLLVSTIDRPAKDACSAGPRLGDGLNLSSTVKAFY